MVKGALSSRTSFTTNVSLYFNFCSLWWTKNSCIVKRLLNLDASSFPRSPVVIFFSRCFFPYCKLFADPERREIAFVNFSSSDQFANIEILSTSLNHS
ncbi:hypothetical protein NPIL_601481 [Nephila pilipes]|uniref:Uncharacterized protein n=1 Tax=Nephila pilipes TaxID=299642 RepID=A0A8X6QQ98_NEPPI|nr:hypothetical protein NPIL_601481 [Nephila pilipes]